MEYLRKLHDWEKDLKAENCPLFHCGVKQDIFIWSIENFSMCCRKEVQKLDSPIFCTNTPISARFSLTIYPKGKVGNEEYISVYLYRASDTAPERVHVGSSLSVVDADGQLCNMLELRKLYQKCEGWGFEDFIRREEVLEKNSKLLPNDTLTFRLEIGIGIEHNESTEKNANQKEEEISVYESLSHDLKNFYESGQCNDVTIKLVDEELKLHRVILGARCSVLENVFEAGRLKHGEANVEFIDVNSDGMKAFISYLYTGKVHSTAYVPLGLYEIACKYGLRELQHISRPNKAHARSKINVKNCCYTWVIENFSGLSCSIGEKVLTTSFLPQGQSFDVLFQPKWSRGDDDDDVSVFLFRSWFGREEEAVRVKFKVSIVDINNELQHTAVLNEMFKTGEKFGFCPFVKRDILIKEQKNLLPNDTLTLQCDISVSDGRLASCEIHEVFLTDASAGFNDNHLRKLGEDLEALYKSKKLSDISVRVKEEEFPVHKVILMARSPVFYDMFSHETAEKETNFIEISDIEPNAVEIMLQYIYSGQLKNVNMHNALELYSASDKYQLLDMKSKCCTYLSSSLTVDNVCDVLILADMHNDDKLKLAAKQYFSSNACKVMETSKWENILKNNLELASVLLQFHDAHFPHTSHAIKRIKFQ